jgi:hypothetical protein
MGSNQNMVGVAREPRPTHPAEMKESAPEIILGYDSKTTSTNKK